MTAVHYSDNQILLWNILSAVVSQNIAQKNAEQGKELISLVLLLLYSVQYTHCCKSRGGNRTYVAHNRYGGFKFKCNIVLMWIKLAWTSAMLLRDEERKHK